MSTDINITVGGEGLLERAAQLQTANRQLAIESYADKKLSEQATTERTKALAAQSKDANGNSRAGTRSQVPQVERRPAATRYGPALVPFWVVLNWNYNSGLPALPAFPFRTETTGFTLNFVNGRLPSIRASFNEFNDLSYFIIVGHPSVRQTVEESMGIFLSSKIGNGVQPEAQEPYKLRGFTSSSLMLNAKLWPLTEPGVPSPGSEFEYSFFATDTTESLSIVDLDFFVGSGVIYKKQIFEDSFFRTRVVVVEDNDPPVPWFISDRK